MNIKDYKDKKSKGLAEIVEAGGGYACTVKKYHVDDGSEVAPETISVDVKLLNKEKAALQSQVEDCDAAIEDISALEKKKS